MMHPSGSASEAGPDNELIELTPNRSQVLNSLENNEQMNFRRYFTFQKKQWCVQL